MLWQPLGGLGGLIASRWLAGRAGACKPGVVTDEVGNIDGDTIDGDAMASRRRLRLLHTSDVHIGGGFIRPKTGEHRDDCVCPLLVLAEHVEREEVDAVLILGDLFDHGRVSDELVTDIFVRLAALPVPVILIPGNHDVHDDDGLYRRHRGLIAEAGVLLFDDLSGSTKTILDGDLTLWGRAMDEHNPGFRPLVNVPGPPDSGWYVAMAHGHWTGLDPDPYRSSPISPEDVAAVDADYVALGHWHRTTELEGEHTMPAWYSGSPIQSWAEGNFLRIDLGPNGAEVVPIPVVPPQDGCGDVGLALPSTEKCSN